VAKTPKRNGNGPRGAHAASPHEEPGGESQAPRKSRQSRRERDPDLTVERSDVAPVGVVARSPLSMRAEAEREEHRKRQIEAVNKAVRAFVAGEEPPDPARDLGPVKQFLLLGGVHVDNDGNVFEFNRGRETIIEDNRPLDSMFMNKFRCLEGDTSPGRDYVRAWDRLGLEDAPLAERQPEGVASEFSTDTERAQRRREERAAQQAQRAAQMAEGAMGDDVTEDFEAAKDADLKVFKKGRRYHVLDGSEVISDDGGLTKDEVEEFIEDNK